MKHLPPGLKSILRTAGLALAMILLMAMPLAARAGGAGASSHSSGSSGGAAFGGSSSGDGGLILFLVVDALGRMLTALYLGVGPIPATLILVAVVIAILLLSRRWRKHRTGALGYLEPAQAASATHSSIPKSFMEAHPDFDLQAFVGKVSHAFITIQEAWSVQDLGKVRRFLSDGVWQRFHTQFAMMALLGQKNRLSDIRIHHIQVASCRKDGPFDVIEVRISASMLDRFASDTQPELNQEGREAFVEYWSFIRLTQVAVEGLDIYQNTQCPHCGAPLPKDLGETGQCPHCSSLVNSGEFDWVLAEITQEGDWATSQAILRGLNYRSILGSIQSRDPDFSVQLAEDKAANVFMQYLRAKATGQPAAAARFLSEKMLQTLQSAADTPSPVIYNRLFLNRVLLLASHRDGDMDCLDFLVTWSRQRAKKTGERVQNLDFTIIEEEQVLRLGRKLDATQAKGSLYQHQCPGCGAPIQDSLDIRCSYCSTVYNSGQREWVCLSLIDRSQYSPPARSQSLGRFLDPASLDQLYDVKDYVVNNLIIMSAADGRFDEAELRAMETLVGQLRYPVANLEALFQLALAGQMRLRMPSDRRMQQKIIQMMQELSEVDGQVSPEEARMLEALRQQYP